MQLRRARFFFPKHLALETISFLQVQMELCLLKQALQGVESLVIGQEKKFELIWWIFQQVQIFSRLLKMAQPSSWSAMAERSQDWADQQTSEKLWSAISQLKSSGMDGYEQQRFVANELHEECKPSHLPFLGQTVPQRVHKICCILHMLLLH